MLLYLAQKNDWVLVPDVFNNANGGKKPEGITSLTGARKALKAIGYVEMENITSTGHPNYQCRIKPDLDSLHDFFYGFKPAPNIWHEFMQSPYYLDTIPSLCDHFNDQLQNEGMPVMTEIEREFLALILKYSETALDFVLIERPDKCKESFKKLEANTKQDSMSLLEMFKDGDRINTIIDAIFLPMKQLMTGKDEHRDRDRLNKERNKVRIILKRVSTRPNTNSNRRLIDMFVNAKHPTWMSLFDELYSKDRYFYDFWLSDEDKCRLDKLMLDKLYFSCKKNDT